MAEERGGWTASMFKAVEYVQRAVREGLTATDALSQYRSGGGAIRDSSWYDLYRWEGEALGGYERFKDIPWTYTIASHFYEPSPFDWRAQYVMRMEVRGWSDELGQYVTKWVTVESDELLTKHEWRDYAQESLSYLLTTSPLELTEVLSWDARQRM